MSTPGDPDNIESHVNRGLAWTGFASALVGILDILSYVIVLAFWISPGEFGVAMIAIALFPALDLATDLGLYAAVVQKDDHSQEKISTLFWVNLALSLTLCAALVWIFGPLLANVQGQPVVASLLSLYGIKLVWQNTYFMPYALMEKQLRFKELSVIRVAANIGEFVAKIGFAAAGFGVFCFVFAPLVRVVVTSIGVQSRCPWRPKFSLQISQAKHWLSFGAKSSAHRILYHLYTNADYQVVAHYFGNTANGLYALAYKIVLEPAYITADVVNKVAFPTFARLKNNSQEIVVHLRKFLRINLILTWAILIPIGVAASDFLDVFWGPEWTEAALLIQILCAVGLLRSLSLLLPPVLDGVGKPGLSLAYTVFAATVVCTGFVGFAWAFGERMGSVSVALAWSCLYPLAVVVLIKLTMDAIDTPFAAIFSGLTKILFCAGTTLGVAFAVHFFSGGLIPSARLAIVCIASSLTFAGLLSKVAEINMSTIRQAISDKSAPQ